MKKVLLIAVLIAGTISFSKAQGGGQGQGGARNMGTPEERATRTLDGQRMTAFNFTADQKAKIMPLLVKFNKSTDSLMATIPADGDRMAAMQAMAPKRTALGTPMESAIVAMLTAEQKKTYDTTLAASKERNPNATSVFTGGGFGGGRGGQGGGNNGGGGNRNGGGGTPPTPPNK